MKKRFEMIEKFLLDNMTDLINYCEYDDCEEILIINERHYYFNEEEFDLYFIKIDKNLNVDTHIEDEELREEFLKTSKDIKNRLSKYDVDSFIKFLDSVY